MVGKLKHIPTEYGTPYFKFNSECLVMNNAKYWKHCTVFNHIKKYHKAISSFQQRQTIYCFKWDKWIVLWHSIKISEITKASKGGVIYLQERIIKDLIRIKTKVITQKR